MNSKLNDISKVLSNKYDIKILLRKEKNEIYIDDMNILLLKEVFNIFSHFN